MMRRSVPPWLWHSAWPPTFGAAIDKSCTADPHQLFLAAVDSSLRQVVK